MGGLSGLAPDQRRMPSALEGKALAFDDHLVNTALIELKTKGRQRCHHTLQDKPLGWVISFAPELGSPIISRMSISTFGLSIGVFAAAESSTR